MTVAKFGVITLELPLNVSPGGAHGAVVPESGGSSDELRQ